MLMDPSMGSYRITRIKGDRKGFEQGLYMGGNLPYIKGLFPQPGKHLCATFEHANTHIRYGPIPHVRLIFAYASSQPVESGATLWRARPVGTAGGPRNGIAGVHR